MRVLDRHADTHRHRCGGDILAGDANGEWWHIYRNRCGAFSLNPDDADAMRLPSDTGQCDEHVAGNPPLATAQGWAALVSPGRRGGNRSASVSPTAATTASTWHPAQQRINSLPSAVSRRVRLGRRSSWAGHRASHRPDPVDRTASRRRRSRAAVDDVAARSHVGRSDAGVPPANKGPFRLPQVVGGFLRGEVFADWHAVALYDAVEPHYPARPDN